MVMTRTPLRVSFVGGGSDIPPGPGAVLASTIDKHVYCIARRRLDDKVYLTWREKEVVDNPGLLKHDIAREALGEIGWEGGIELIFFADVPGVGSGLGSSAATCVSLLHALLALQGYESKELDPRWLADLACNVALKRLGRPQGRQDETICALGACQRIVFKAYSGEVESIREQRLKPHQLRALSWHFSLFRSSGSGRDANEILDSFNDRPGFRRECQDLVDTFETRLVEERFSDLAELVALHHQLKNKNFSKYSHGGADHRTLPNGRVVTAFKELDFKLCGAGGSGHLLVGVTPRTRERVSEVLTNLWGPELPFRFVDYGTSVIYSE